MKDKTENKQIVFRLDAGISFGLGHLSRCLTLANEFIGHNMVVFIIKTDNRDRANAFIKVEQNNNLISVIYIDSKTSVEKDIEIILETLAQKPSFLILDHYSINEEYQLKLKNNNIKWLQFDSHAQQNFYADFVLHASPAATCQLYKPLQKNPNTKFLLGTSYAVINNKFRNIRDVTNARNQLRKILICFGGGDDRGATLKCLRFLETAVCENISIDIVTGNKDFKEIENITKKWNNIKLIMDSNNLEEQMANSDLGIIAPGTLSYEAACVGLPMLLITIADNQNINAKGWVDTGCAIGLGTVDNLSSEGLNSSIKELINHPIKLRTMSENGFNQVDGLGALRAKNEIIPAL